MPTISTSIQIDRPPAEVWQVLLAFEGWPAWTPMTVRMEGRPEVGAPVRLQSVLREGGRQIPARARLLVVEPSRELRWGGGLGGLLWIEHWFGLSPEGAGTRVEHTERFEGLLARPGVRLLGLGPGIYQRALEGLKRRVEADGA